MVWPYRPYIMARTSIKATYSLDTETVRLLDRLSRRMNVSKSEALRHAIHAASASAMPSDAETRLAAWKRLQKSLNLTQPQVDAWISEVRAERDAWRDPWAEK